MTDLPTLQSLVADLRNARRAHTNNAAEIAEIQARIDASPDGCLLHTRKAIQAENTRACEGIDQALRYVAVLEYTTTGDKTPAPGVQIRVYHVPTYDPATARTWCLEHVHRYLTLDVKAFDKAAPTLADLGAPVIMTDQPRATIATNLEEVTA